jgi:hypothetical protein
MDWSNWGKSEAPSEAIEIMYRREFKLSHEQYEAEPIDQIEYYFAFIAGENKRLERGGKRGR